MSKRVFRSLIEIEKEYCPESYKKKLEEKENKKPEEFGTGLVKEIMDEIRQKLREEGK